MQNKIVIGTVQFGLNYGITNKKGKIDKDEIKKIFNFCNNNGIIYFDTAQDYGESEDILSKFNLIYPNFKIITKSKFQNKNLDDTIGRSLEKFKYIECFMLHSFKDFSNKILINKLIKFKKENIIKKIGVSVYNVDEVIELLDDNNVDIIQIPFNYLDKQWFDNKFQKKVKKTNKEIHVRSIFLQGILLNKPLIFPKNIDESDFLDLETKIYQITNKLNISKLELCFYFANSFDWINKIIIGIDNFDHLLSNFKVIEKNLKLEECDIQYIKEQVSNINTLLIDPSKWELHKG